MTEILLTIVPIVCAVLIGEVMLWRTFRQRVDPVVYPEGHDASQIGFFRMGRMRWIAMVHAGVLIVWTVVSTLWLW